MSFLAPASPSLKSLDREGRVIHAGSFSKSRFDVQRKRQPQDIKTWSEICRTCGHTNSNRFYLSYSLLLNYSHLLSYS